MNPVKWTDLRISRFGIYWGVAALLLSLILGSCGKSKSGVSPTPASWSSQLALALQSGKEADPSAVLTRVSADASQTLGMSSELTAAFFFYNPKPIVRDQATWAAETRVSFATTAPTSTLRIDAPWDIVSPVPKRELAEYQDALAYVKLSADDILELTNDLAESHYGARYGSVYPVSTLLLAGKVPGKFGVPAVWVIDYIISDGSSFYLYLDAESGKILEQR